MQEKSVKFEKDKTVNFHASKTNLDRNFEIKFNWRKIIFI